MYVLINVTRLRVAIDWRLMVRSYDPIFCQQQMENTNRTLSNFEARLDHLSQKLDNQMDQFNRRLDSYMEYCDRKVSNNEGDIRELDNLVNQTHGNFVGRK
jgi:predicted RNase H-like nuclease (RuvC/YqgF family)